MSDLQPSSSSPVASFPIQGAVSPGALLRQARQDQGLHIETVAASLKVSVAKLEALETDQFHTFPDANFVRAFAGSVCRTLKIDAAPVLAALPPGALPRLAQNSEGINTRLRDERSRGLFTLLGGKPIALAVFALLLGALVLFFLPERPVTEAEPEAFTEEVVPSAEPQPTTAPSNVPPVVVPVPAVVAPSPAVPAATMPVVPPAASPGPVAPPASVPLSSAPQQPPVSSHSGSVAAAPLSASPASVNPTNATAEVLVLSARATSWVHVRDAKGATVFQRTLGAGERAVISQAPPLSVTVGRADMTDVTIRGVPFSTTTLSQSNVARFEVK